MATKKKRDDFSPKIKSLLAERAALRCSNPDCRILTKGPATERDSIQNAGCAAHITAAANGGPRYDRALTPDERSAPSNGLWLCRNCGERVDDDVLRYPASLLRKWKADIEFEVEQALGKPAPLSPRAEPFVTWVVEGEEAAVLEITYSNQPSFVDDLIGQKFGPRELGSLSGEQRTQAEKFNSEVELYCAEHQALVELDRDATRWQTDAVAVTVRLCNDGTEPLKGARLFLRFAEQIRIASTAPQSPTRPPAPRRPSFERRARSLPQYFSLMESEVHLAVREPFIDSFLTSIVNPHHWGLDIDDSEDGILEAYTSHLTHRLSKSWDSVKCVFCPAQPAEYEVEVEVYADNLVVPWRGTLSIRVNAPREDDDAAG